MKRQFNLLGIYWIVFCLIYCIGIDQVYVIEIPEAGRKLFSIAFLMSNFFKCCLCAFLMGGIFVFVRRMKQNDMVDTNQKTLIETWWKSIFIYQLAFALFQVTNNSEKILYYAAMRVLMISPVAVWLSLLLLASGLLFVTGKRFKVKGTSILVLKFVFLFLLTFVLFQIITLLIVNGNYLRDGTNLKPLFSLLWFSVIIMPGLFFLGYGRKFDQSIPLLIKKEKNYDL